MSAIKSKYGHITILDFSKNKITKTSVRKSIRNANFFQSRYSEGGISFDFIDNEIDVGTYKIRIFLDITREGKKLRDYGRFYISIYEQSVSACKIINLSKDSRFKYQYWVDYNSKEKLNISHLTDAILHCKRLDSLKAFL